MLVHDDAGDTDGMLGSLCHIEALVTWFVRVRRRVAAAPYLRVLGGEMTARGWSCSVAPSAVPTLWITPDAAAKNGKFSSVRAVYTCGR
ncbi:hypothetical protein [Actinomadura flavalba]|uniref:hypothetical protein n=1 Tax=Actinomadura flavalba TaxID=1120938 RepID=UPI00146B2D5E|nr:hypothetical protein [Actinomadura flavalba]